MNYTLITRNGKILMFYVFSAAVIYQKAYGGVIMDTTIPEEKSVVFLQHT